MGIFSRINDIVSANIVHMLDKAEDPEKMVRLMIQEMEDTLIEVKSSAAKLIADRKKLESEYETMEREMLAWQKKAEFAVDKGRDDLARGALSQKLRISEDSQSLQVQIKECDHSLGQLKDDIAVLNQKLEDARKRQRSLIVRRQSLKNQKKIQNTLDRHSTVKAFEKFEAYENDLYRLEGEVEASRLRQNGSQNLNDELKSLENNDAIEEELKSIRLRVKQPQEIEAESKVSQ